MPKRTDGAATGSRGAEPHRSQLSMYSANLPGCDGRHIPGLDAMRAISVALVIVAHSGFAKFIPGDLGVTVFFFVSGFLITNLLISESFNTGDVSIRNFYIRRYLRLSPELFFFVIFCLILSLLFFAVRWIDVVGSLFYFENYVRIFAPDHVATTPYNYSHLWSLSVEEHFYLIMPFLYVMLRNRWRPLLRILLIVCIVAPFYRWFALEVIGPHVPFGGSEYTGRATDARIDSIAFGCLLAVWCRHSGVIPRFAAKYYKAMFASAVVLMLASLGIRVDFFKQIWQYTFQGVSLFLLFPALFFGAIGVALLPILEHPLLRLIGRLSYGMYLWHMVPVWTIRYLGTVDPAFQPSLTIHLLTLAIAFPWAVFAAYCSERFLLRPFTALRHRFGSQVYRDNPVAVL